MEAVRGWTDDPIHTLIYTHGHVDHVGGSGAMAADAAGRGHEPIRVVGHHCVAERFRRYELTNGYNTDINMRQFGAVGGVKDMALGDVPQFLPDLLAWHQQPLSIYPRQLLVHCILFLRFLLLLSLKLGYFPVIIIKLYFINATNVIYTYIIKKVQSNKHDSK